MWCGGCSLCSMERFDVVCVVCILRLNYTLIKGQEMLNEINNEQIYFQKTHFRMYHRAPK